MRSSTFLLSSLLILSVSSRFARADDQAIQQRLLEAKDLYSQRLDLANVDRALNILLEIEPQAQDSMLRYDIFDLMARAYNCKSFHMDADKDTKLALYEKGMEAAESAMDENDQLSEAPYHYAVNLGRWGITKGVADSLERKDELMQALETAESLQSIDGIPGDRFEGYGVTMALGRMYYKLPGFAGGNTSKAKELLEKAHAGAPEHAENVIYLAEVLHVIGGSENQARARSLLDNLLAQDPQEYNPNRPLETTDAFKEGRELRNRMGN